MSWARKPPIGHACAVSEHSTTTALRLRPPAHRVSRRAIGYWTAMASIFWIVVIGVLTAIVVTSDDPPSFLTVALVVACVVGPLHLVVMPQWRYRVHRWEVTGEAVYTQSGWLKQEWRVAAIFPIPTLHIELYPGAHTFRRAQPPPAHAAAPGPLPV